MHGKVEGPSLANLKTKVNSKGINSGLIGFSKGQFLVSYFLYGAICSGFFIKSCNNSSFHGFLVLVRYFHSFMLSFKLNYKVN